MELGFISYWNASEVKHWSGTVYFMHKYLQKTGINLTTIDQLRSPIHDIYKIKSLYYKLTNREYLRFREPRVVRSMAKNILRKIKGKQLDALISAGSLEISMLDTKIPIIFWTDATFEDLLDYYPDCTNLPKSNVKDAQYLEQEAFNRSSLAIFSSDWAAASAMKHYDINPNKIRVVQFGANLDNPPSYEEIRERIENKDQMVCKFLFLGVHWYRKGGDIALETIKELNKIGVKAELHVVGCSPDIPNKPDFVTIYGYLKKSIPEEKEIIEKLYRESHFLILPSRADCTPIVFSEANANGLPAISSNEGGITSVIKSGLNGETFEINVDPENIAKYIAEQFTDYKKYKTLAYSSYQEYQTRLNWPTACTEVTELIKTVI
jgi:glycosyltransferase involved in cell wall biosynthesis